MAGQACRDPCAVPWCSLGCWSLPCNHATMQLDHGIECTLSLSLSESRPTAADNAATRLGFAPQASPCGIISLTSRRAAVCFPRRAGLATRLRATISPVDEDPLPIPEAGKGTKTLKRTVRHAPIEMRNVWSQFWESLALGSTEAHGRSRRSGGHCLSPHALREVLHSLHPSALEAVLYIRDGSLVALHLPGNIGA